MALLTAAVMLMTMFAMAVPATALTPTLPPAQAPAGQEPVEAPPEDDAINPAWDDTIQQAAGSQSAGDGEDALDPDADVEIVPSVVMKLVEQQLPLKGVKIGIDPGHQAKGNNQKETIAARQEPVIAK